MTGTPAPASETTAGTAAGNERIEGSRFFPGDIRSGGGVGDTLVGGVEDDVLRDEGGQATLAGGEGADQYHVGGSGDAILESALDHGVDVVWATADHVLAANVEQLLLLAGTAGTGNAGPNLITGNAGANRLDGGANTDQNLGDTLAGGDGDDRYVVHSGQDSIVEGPFGGHDTAILPADMQIPWQYQPTLNWRMPREVEAVQVEPGWQGTTPLGVFGNDWPNTMTGSPQGERLEGDVGDDTLTAAGGNDTLGGGPGADWLLGGDGDDRYIADPGDTLVELEGGGWDVLQLDAETCALPLHFEELRLDDPVWPHEDAVRARIGIGNDAANILRGNELDNRLEGGAGDDTLEGGTGADTYLGGAGDDTVDDTHGTGTALYAGPQSAYQVVREAGGWTVVSGPEGTDRLLAVERLRFADAEQVLDRPGSVQVAIDASEVAMGRLQAVVSAAEDPDGVGSVRIEWFRSTFDGHIGEPMGEGTTLDLGTHSAIGSYFWTAQAHLVDVNGYTVPAASTPYQWNAASEEPQALPALLDIDVARLGDGRLEVQFLFDGAPDRDSLVSISFYDYEEFYELFGLDHRLQFEGSRITATWPADLEAGETVAVGFTGWPGGNDVVFRVPDDGPRLPGPHPRPLDAATFSHDLSGAIDGITLRFDDVVQPGAGSITLYDGDHAIVHAFDVGGPAVFFGRQTIHLPLNIALVPGEPYRIAWVPGVLLDEHGLPGGEQALELPLMPLWKEGSFEDDHLDGTGNGDDLRGADGNDTLAGFGGGDRLWGGAGADTVIMDGGRAHYWLAPPTYGDDPPDWSRPTRDWTATDLREPTEAPRDLLWDVEQVRFDDYTLDLTMAWRVQGIGPESQRLLAELYVAFFGRVAEAEGLAHWLDELRAGATFASIADQFHAAGVSFGVFPQGQSANDFVRGFYTHVLGRDEASAQTPTQQELAYWTSQLEAGTHSRGTMVLQMLQDVHMGFEGDAEYGWVERMLDHKAALARWYALEQGLGRLTPEQDIAFGRELAELVTPDGYQAAIDLVGIGASAMPT